MGITRRTVGIAVLGTAALVLASCGFGRTDPADRVSDIGVRLKGGVANTVTGSTAWWFEYGPTDAYGSSTVRQHVTVTDTEATLPVSFDLWGLAEGTDHHYRLCVQDNASGHGSCGLDQTVTTSTGHDHVTGSGIVFTAGLGDAIGGSVTATVGADGSLLGRVEKMPGSAYFRIPDVGAPTCLRVEGNRATIGFVREPTFTGDPELEPPIPYLVFVEDNGPTGDRWGARVVDAPPTDCPAATSADFPDFEIATFVVPPVLISGDFAVHDHSAAH